MTVRESKGFDQQTGLVQGTEKSPLTLVEETEAAEAAEDVVGSS